MKCYDREKLFSFVHQMLKPEETEAVRSHLAECTQCQQVVEEYRKLDGTLDGWAIAEPSPWFDARVQARVAASGKEKSGFLGIGRVRVLAVSVLSMVLIVAGFIAFHQRQARQAPGTVAGPSSPQVSQTGARSAGATEAQVQSLSAEQQLKMDENLSVLEDYDLLANFDVLSELPQAKDN
jgi:anti-sigma factor RsiW